jgi:hypothetical protein
MKTPEPLNMTQEEAEAKAMTFRDLQEFIEPLDPDQKALLFVVCSDGAVLVSKADQ